MNAATPFGRSSAPRSVAVSGIAWGFIACSGLTLALLPLLSGETLAARLGVEAGSGGLTGGVAWLIARGDALAPLLATGALATLCVAVALLRRRSWARRAFVILMGLGVIGVLGGAALTPLTFGLLPDAASGAAAPDASPDASPMAELVVVLGLTIVIATLLLVLFAWSGWRLTTPAARAEFASDDARSTDARPKDG